MTDYNPGPQPSGPIEEKSFFDKTWVRVVGVILLVLVIISACSGGDSDESPESSETPSETVTVTETPEPTAETPLTDEELAEIEDSEEEAARERRREALAERQEKAKTNAMAREYAFLSVVRSEIPVYQSVPDKTLIKEAKYICKTYRSVGVSELTLVQGVTAFTENSGGLVTFEEAAYFIGSATAGYCPEIAKDIENLSAGSNV